MKTKIFYLFIALLFCAGCTDDTVTNSEQPEKPKEENANEGKDDSEPITNTLPVKFELLRDSIWPTQSGKTYFVRSTYPYLLGRIQDIFIGEFVDANLGKNIRLDSIPLNYNYNPITCSNPAGPNFQVFKDIIPGIQSMNSINNHVFKKTSTNSLFYSSYDGFYTSRKNLYLAYAHTGLKIDSIIVGKRFWEKPMTKKFGFSICSEMRTESIDMDLNDTIINRKLDNSTLAPFQPAIIFSMYYGLLKILITESDYKNIAVCIKKTIANETLSNEETEVLNNSDIYTISFENHILICKKGKEALSDFTKIKQENITLLNCSLQDYKDLSPKDIEWQIDLREETKE